MEKIFPQFEPAMGTSGRWFVSVQTGKGPNSHIGDFETESRQNAGLRPKRNTGPANRTHQRDATRRGGGSACRLRPPFLGVGIVSADQAECALMKLMVASLTTPLYLGQLTQSQS